MTEEEEAYTTVVGQVLRQSNLFFRGGMGGGELQVHGIFKKITVILHR